MAVSHYGEGKMTIGTRDLCKLPERKESVAIGCSRIKMEVKILEQKSYGRGIR